MKQKISCSQKICGQIFCCTFNFTKHIVNELQSTSKTLSKHVIGFHKFSKRDLMDLLGNTCIFNNVTMGFLCYVFLSLVWAMLLVPISILFFPYFCFRQSLFGGFFLTWSKWILIIRVLHSPDQQQQFNKFWSSSIVFVQKQCVISEG